MAAAKNSAASAKPDDAAQGWPGLLSELQKSFNLLRDVFGYAMPGAVFLSIGLLSGRISLRQFAQLLYPYQLPAWGAVIFLVIVCYVVGQVLAAIAYTPANLRKYFRARKNPHDPWVKEHPTEVSSKLLEIQRLYPSFLMSAERRETISIFIGSTMAALLGGAVVFCFHWLNLCSTLVIAGIILFSDFWTAMPHLRRVHHAVAEAYVEAEQYEKEHSGDKAKSRTDPGDVKQALVELIKAATDAIGKL
jgi:hypothetical protein